MVDHDASSCSESPGREEDPGEEAARPGKKRRLNRIVTSCEVCRRSKTRCEVVPGNKSCRRCMSLRIECDRPVPTDAEPNRRAQSPIDLEHRSVRLEDLVTRQRRETAGSSVNVDTRSDSIERSIKDSTSLVRGASQSNRAQNTSSHVRVRRESDTTYSTNNRGSPYKPSDGVTRPVLLLRNLQTQFFGPKRDFSDEVLASGSVVSNGIISSSLARYLIQSFVRHYGVWVSLKHPNDLPDNLETEQPLLFSTACLLASRFVPSISKTVGHEMYSMVRRLAACVVLKPPPLDYESSQSLLSLSMFSPTVQTAMPIDSWSMSALAINHATLPFNISGSEQAQPDFSDMQLKRLRIWNGLCLTHIQFSIGNGRQSIVQKAFVDYCSQILSFPEAICEDARSFAEVLLYSRTENLLNHSDVLCKGETIVFDDLVQWKTTWNHILESPECVTAKFSYLFCYLLSYRVSLRAQSSSATLRNAALETSRGILSYFLELDFSVVSDMPDYYFFITIYAALTSCKFDISEPLITATQTCLMDLAPNDEHIAFRFGTVLEEIRRKAAAAGTSTTQLGAEDQVEPSMWNDNYAWDVMMAGLYPLDVAVTEWEDAPPDIGETFH